MFFGHQRDVRPNVVPYFGMTYHEFIFAIPFVQWRQERHAPAYRGPFAYMPRLYLDKLWPTVLGYMYGYPKTLARIHQSEQGGYRVRDLVLDRPLIRATFRPEGESAPPAAFEHFEAIRSIFKIPIIAKLEATPYLCSRMTFHLDEATLRSAPCTVELQDAILPGVLPDTRASRGLADQALGSFELRVPWELTLPFRCDRLSC